MAKTIDWLYHRKNCVTCEKAAAWRGEAIVIGETVDARKVRFDEAAALKLVEGLERIIAAKGKKIDELKLKDKPDDEVILALIMGPTGNLRAPAARIGKTLLVGFTPELYEKHLSAKSV